MKKNKSKQKIIAITTGDHDGIGPEVIAKGLRNLRKNIAFDSVIIFGDPELYRPWKKYLPKKIALWDECPVFEPGWDGPLKGHLNFILPHTRRGLSKKAFLAGRYIELAAEGCFTNIFSAMVTGPIDKTILQKGGYKFSGHTDMLEFLCKSKQVTMMLASPQMRVSLVTTHISLKDVSKKLSKQNILKCIENTEHELRTRFKIKKPRLAVLGLNPHAGEAGLFGKEERLKIIPAIKTAQKKFKNSVITGPHPADGFFAQWNTKHRKNTDAVICMYHDQGLIPVKLTDFKSTVNITLGLPIIRTSVDHGVAYDIAGKGIADPASFCAALLMANSLVKNAKKS